MSVSVRLPAGRAMVSDLPYDDGLQSSNDLRAAEGQQRRFRASLRDIGDDFRYPYDDSVSALDELLEPADEGATIAELMRHDVGQRVGGSRGRRRREPAKARDRHGRSAHADSATGTSRIGRPAIGAEVRVYVQTSIAQRTREILAARGITLADVFDDVARRLVEHER